jgi:tetratricopeptide (TPR) repeat protein
VSELAPSIEEVVENFLAQRRSGSTIDARTFAAQHPRLLPELLDALQSAETLEGARDLIDEEMAPVLSGRVGPYRIEREIGRGGMGVVLEAVEEPLGRRVALKLLPPALLSSAAARARFRREAVLASRLEHPGVCTVYGAAVTDGQPWIAMRFVEGTTLAKRISAAKERGAHCVDLPGVLDVDAARGIAACIARVARALAYAHAQGVLHRDVKPSNLLVNANGEAILLDFGLAIEPASDAPGLTRTGETAGTPAYLAPELISGERARPDERCDVYALGVSLYECLTLATPFSGPTREALFRSTLTGGAPDVRSSNRDVPRDLAVVVATALERDPARRYATAELFAADLEAFVAGRPIAARPVGSWGRILRWTKREPRQALLAGTLSIAALALTLVAGILIASRADVRAGRAAQRAKTIDATLFDAFVDLGEKRAEQADTRFVQVLELDPVNADAKVGRVLALLRLRRNEQALELLRDAPGSPGYERLRALATDAPPLPEDPSWFAHASAFELFVDGEGLRLEGERHPPSEQVEWMRKALARFDEAVVRAPQARALYHQIRAATADEAHDQRAARSASAALVALWPDSARALFQAGAAINDFAPREALVLLERAAELDPEHAPTFQGIGASHCFLREWDEALEPLHRAIAIDPNDVEAYNALGGALMNLEGCEDDARAALLAAVALDPRSIKPWANLCKVAPDPESTALALEHVLELDPGQTPYRAYYGEILEKLDHLPRACEQFAIVVAEQPARADYWAAYARVLTENDQLRTAVDAAAIARSIDPQVKGLDEVEEYLRHAKISDR